MSKMRMSVITSKKCVFCKYWRGSPAASTKMKNYWEFETDDKGECIKFKKIRTAHKPGCASYVLDSYKYPEI